MSDQLISCIIPVFNGELYIREAVDSILAQQHRPLEVIVVDDGSTDKTSTIVKSFGNEVILISQANAGPPSARNAGLKAASGDFVAFLDADDVWRQDKLVKQMAQFDNEPQLDIVLSNLKNFWTPDLPDSGLKKHEQVELITPYMLSATLCRKSLFDRIGNFDPTLSPLGDDTDWFRRVDQSGVKIHIVPEVLVYRRLHAANISLHGNVITRDALFDHLRSSVHKRKMNTPSQEPETANILVKHQI